MAKKTLTHGSLFSGIGGFELAALRVGIPTLWNCEIVPFNRQILKKHFPYAKQYDDIRTMQQPEPVDIISGGFPCQDISSAGKGKGILGERSSLWFEMFRIIREVRPRYIIAENSPNIIIRGLEYVLCDLSKIGYDAEWQCLSASDFGYEHKRERCYIIAYDSEIGQQSETVFRKLEWERPCQHYYNTIREFGQITTESGSKVEPSLCGINDGLPNRVDRVSSLGNAVVPGVVQYLFECIKFFEASILPQRAEERGANIFLKRDVA